MKILFFSLLIATGSAHADFAPDLWHFRAPLSVPQNVPTTEFVVTKEVFRYSTSQLSDLRIIRDAGVEIPYVVRFLGGEIQNDERMVAIRDKSWTASKGVRAVLDLGTTAEHNRLRISTSQRNFKQAVTVETSGDAAHWSTVLRDGVIFDISRPEAQVSDLTVTYPTSTRRFVRITIPGWTDPAELESAWLSEHRETDATRDTIGQFPPAVTERKAEQATNVLFDLGYQGQPCDRLILQVAPGFFSRSVEISTGNDLKLLVPRTGFAIDRTRKDEHLMVEWTETWDRYIQLTVFNGDSAPLTFGAATASAVRRIVRFPSNTTGTYWLYLGNAAAHTPVYDFARVDEATARAGLAKIGGMEPNPEFRTKLQPYSERKPWVLNLILGIAVAAMAYITYRFAHKATSTKA